MITGSVASLCLKRAKARSFPCLLMALMGIATPVMTGGEYAETIRPILSQNCFKCHGPDEKTRKADLRLDRFEDATLAQDGVAAIVPGRPLASELYQRIVSHDPDEQMPPTNSKLTLSPEQKKAIEEWILSGAEYERHWAFIPPVKREVPSLPAGTQAAHPIDAFVVSALARDGLRPNSQADPYTLLRRLYFDLIGLPPTPDDVDRWIGHGERVAWLSVVDHLLESPHFGEKWGRHWLDLARYADTNGYEKDRPRSIWPYRDWVIKALNEDLPFDRFSIEQLAGDMLAEAGESQRVATGFHRNTMLNEEGGIDPLEFRFYAMVDRVATTGATWLGLTLGCAQCHTHKYDPLSHQEYYGFMAYLDNADEPEMRLAADDPEGESVAASLRLKEEELIATLLTKGAPNSGDHVSEFEKWVSEEASKAVAWQTLELVNWTTNLPKLEVLSDGSIFSSGDITKRDVFTMEFEFPEGLESMSALRLEVLPDERLPAGGPGRCYYEGRKGDFFLSELSVMIDGKRLEFGEGSVSHGSISVGSGPSEAKNVLDGDGSTGWSTSKQPGKANQMVLNLTQPVKGKKIQIEMIFERHFAASLGRFRFDVASVDRAVEAKRISSTMEALLSQIEEASAADLWALKKAYLYSAESLKEMRAPLESLANQRPSPVTTLVMEERPADNPRLTYRRHRGEYLQPRERIEPHLPEIFGVSDAEMPRDRLALARWLVSPSNPLGARVTVNRVWQSLFGRGLVATSEDFGMQGDLPSHPALLDWLAVEFMDQGWSLKKLLRNIVSSSTYQQSAVVSWEQREADPDNRRLSRGPRKRMSAELVRDSMLASSGLLNREIGGESVYPPQPASVTQGAYGGGRWNVSKGADRYRRSLYTHAKRTAPFAAYTTFDAPTGENCVVRRNTSNTPLQALTLLNDPIFVECAQAAAVALAQENRKSVEARIEQVFRQFLVRYPTADEVALLLAYWNEQRTTLERGERHAEAVAGRPDASAEMAAWTLLVRAIMNLDEAINI